MLNSIVVALLPTLVSLAIFVGAAIWVVYYQNKKNEKRWSPLTSKLLRSPGYKLVQEIDDTNFDISANLFMTWMIPMMMYAAHVSGSYFAQQSESVFRIGLNVTVVMLMEIWVLRKLLSLLATRRRIREGYEAESAVGSELNQLMLDGAHVFHDLQAEGFNIDHVIVSPKGVFCVETKSRVKYALENGKTSAKVEFDGRALKFSSHTETAPIDQVKMNAKWLKDWLSKAVGEPVNARPVLALPGWFITLTARSDVIVINGKNCRSIFASIPAHQVLSPVQVERIAYQVEQRCRDIEPTKYRKAEKPIAVEA